MVQLPQPYYIGSIRLLLWDCDDRSYSYYIDVSTDHLQWHRVVDMRNEKCRSWQTITFSPRPVCYVKIVGTHNTANEVFHCVHFECPAPASELPEAIPASSVATASSTVTSTTAPSVGTNVGAQQSGVNQLPFLHGSAGPGKAYSMLSGGSLKEFSTFFGIFSIV